MASIFFRVLVLSLAFVAYWLQEANAFDPLNSTPPVIQSAYARTQDTYESKYQALQKNLLNGVFSDAQKTRLSQAESRIKSAYETLSTAQTSRAKKIAQRSVNLAVRRLDTLLLSMSREVSVILPIRTPNTQASSSIVTSWRGATDAEFLYYADTFQDGRTANGDIFRHEGFSGARCNILLGTLAQLRYEDKAVTVKLNDRPNCTKHPDIVDLTRTTFTSLGRLSQGRLKGSFIPLEVLPTGLAKEYLPTDFFAPLGVTLSPETPNIYLPGDTLTLRGRTIAWGIESLIYIEEPDGNIVSYGQDGRVGGAFEYFIPLTKPGKYELVLASGRSFSGAKSLSFTVLDPKIVALKQYFGALIDTDVSFDVERTESADLSPTTLVRIKNPTKNTLYTLRIQTQGQTIEASGMWVIALPSPVLESLRSSNPASLEIFAQGSSTNYSIDTFTPRRLLKQGSYTLAPLYKSEENISYTAIVNENILRITLGDTPSRISGTAYIITPSGGVDAVKFDSQYLATDGTLSTTNGASFSYIMRDPWVYLVEVNYDTGFAAVITPVTFGSPLTLLSNVLDTSSRKVEASTLQVAERTLAEINTLRSALSLGRLSLDPTLTRLAQAKADDMAVNNYVGHTDSSGNKIDAMAKRLGITLKWWIWENVAGGTVSFAYLQAGLSLSGGHRLNMLKPTWGKVGIGTVIRNGKTSLVQVFGE